MSENLFKDDNEALDREKEEVKKDFQGLLGSSRRFLGDLLEIRKASDPTEAKESIVADISFKGHNAWILVCSIFIASIGLNANSTAVVIGAMLISPLMGPILGMGMSLAINDVETLRKSLNNFLIMVILSVFTAFLFFYSFPIQDESSELLARTKPDIRDVLIAFFGGLALIIARAKKGTLASVIYGVAIATALMPPLCTVGFGLAIGNWWYALGAMYLFIINTIFIALATFLVIKYLRFPMVRYANSRRRRRIARIASGVGLLVMLPAGYTFYMAFNESLFKKQAQEFLSETIEIYEFAQNGRYLDNLTKIEYDYSDGSLIEIVCMGSEEIPANVESSWRNKKNTYSRLLDTEFNIVQGGRDDSVEKFEYVTELYESKKAELLTKDQRIEFLEGEIVKLSQNQSKQIPFNEVVSEARINYENLSALGFGYRIETDFNKTDTIPVFEIKWKNGVGSNTIANEQQKLTNWLKVRLQDSTIQVKTVN